MERLTAGDFQIELEQEDDGRWIAEVINIPGIMAYGSTKTEALAKVRVLARIESMHRGLIFSTDEIPCFETEQEEVEFWDTHNLAQGVEVDDNKGDSN